MKLLTKKNADLNHNHNRANTTATNNNTKVTKTNMRQAKETNEENERYLRIYPSIRKVNRQKKHIYTYIGVIFLFTSKRRKHKV